LRTTFLEFFATFPSRSVNVIVSVAFTLRAFFSSLRPFLVALTLTA
jgi:hypothetical protein